MSTSLPATFTMAPRCSGSRVLIRSRTAGGMLIYTGIAFFFRPEPNTDNLGWGGGLGNDPFQTSDNVNRFLWKALPGPLGVLTQIRTLVVWERARSAWSGCARNAASSMK